MSRIINTAINWVLSKKSKSYEKRMLALVIISFILSRLLYFLGGIRFDALDDSHLMQFIFPELLRNNLLQSVFYLHSQPPLFNLFMGLILKLFPVNSVLVYHSFYLVFGVLLAISLFYIMTRLGVSSILSTVLTILFIVSPSCILFENLLLYTYPVTAFLCLSALFLHKFLWSDRLRDGILFFTFLSVIVLSRSFFHIIWFIMFLVILLFSMRHIWKKIVIVSCIPFLVIFLVYAKNDYIFGSFSSSSWLGASFAKITTFMLTEDERIKLWKEVKISELAFIPAIRGLWTYHDHVNVPEFKKTNIPILDLEYYSLRGNNFNNLAFKSLSKQYLKDAIHVLRTHPEAYAKGLLSSFRCFFFPSSDWFITRSTDNLKKTRDAATFYNTVFYGQFLNIGKPKLKGMENYGNHMGNILNIGLFLIIGFVIAVCYGIRLLLKAFKRKPINIPFVLTIGFLLINIMYVTVVGNFLEVGENQRFRFNIDPFLLILLGLFVNDVLNKCKHITYLSLKRKMVSENRIFEF